MINRVPMAEMYPLISEMLEHKGEVTITVSGSSMQPMLYDCRDTVTIVKPEFPLKKYDLPLFRLDNGKFVLHRVVKVCKDGTYTCQGDNRWTQETPISNEQIIGVVRAFDRNGKQVEVDSSFGYWFYTRTWGFFHYFKRYYKYLRFITSKFKK